MNYWDQESYIFQSMTIAEYRAKLRATIKELEFESERLALAIVQSGLAIVEHRSIEEGIFVNSEEGVYADYSVNPMLTVRFRKNVLNQKGLNYIAENRLGTWHEFRKAQGLTSEKVNLSYTNRLWTSIAIQSTTSTGSHVVFTIGSIDTEVQKYIGKLAERYGNFIMPTHTERIQLNQDFVTDLVSFLKRRL